MDRLLQELQEDYSRPNDSRPNDSRPNKLWPNELWSNKLWYNKLWKTIKKLKLFSGSFDTIGVFKLGTIATFEFSAKLTIGKK